MTSVFVVLWSSSFLRTLVLIALCALTEIIHRRFLNSEPYKACGAIY